MDAVTWSVSIGLVAAAALHIGEETVKDFRGFLNTQWFDGTTDCPVGRRPPRRCRKPLRRPCFLPHGPGHAMSSCP